MERVEGKTQGVIFKRLVYDTKYRQEIEAEAQNNKNIRDQMDKMIIRTKCHDCGKDIKEEEFKQVSSYWGSFIVPMHKNCKNDENVYECQKIDADCNDCLYFVRGELEAKGIFNGECSKFNKSVKAYPNFCSGHKCFKHRKDDIPI